MKAESRFVGLRAEAFVEGEIEKADRALISSLMFPAVVSDVTLYKIWSVQIKSQSLGSPH